MIVRRPTRLLALAAALATALAPMAVGAGLSDATAASPKQHQLTTYKVEKQLDIPGEFPDNSVHDHLYCNPGDYALDGMWRVDHVDQANPDLGVSGDERDIRVDASYGDDVDPAKWHFRIVNDTVGANAQLKLFVTCLAANTEGQNGHSHPVVLSSRTTRTVGIAAVLTEWDHSTTCGANALAVAPGFNFTAGQGRIYRSWPSSATFRSWHWAFVAPDSATVSLYLRCLSLKTGGSGTGPHAHALRYTWVGGYGGSLYHLPVGHQVNRELACGDQEKGMVGAFWINDPFHVWFLGMDPRPKIRNFRYWNDGGGDDSVYHSLLCLNSRTGFQVAP
jgi:hypothetical protein